MSEQQAQQLTGEELYERAKDRGALPFGEIGEDGQAIWRDAEGLISARLAGGFGDGWHFLTVEQAERAYAHVAGCPDEGRERIESAITDPAQYCERVQHEYSALHDTEPMINWQTRAVVAALGAVAASPDEEQWREAITAVEYLQPHIAVLGTEAVGALRDIEVFLRGRAVNDG